MDVFFVDAVSFVLYVHVDANYILDDVDVDAVVVGAIADVVVDVKLLQLCC